MFHVPKGPNPQDQRDLSRRLRSSSGPARFPTLTADGRGWLDVLVLLPEIRLKLKV